MNKILIIIPAYNEEKNIEIVVNNLINNFHQYDYVIINDGSTDRTEELCNQNRYNVIHLPINLGIGGAVQAGYRYALKHKYDIAIQIDGDGQHNIDYVKDLVDEINNNGADIAIGSRFIDKEGFQSSFTRRTGIVILSIFIRLLSRANVKDVTSGFRAVNEKFIGVYANNYPSDYPEPEAIVMGVMHRANISEVPVIMNERLGGESSITLRKSIYYMIKVSIALFITRISYGVRRETRREVDEK